jgi:YD repeat-containing protein
LDLSYSYAQSSHNNGNVTTQTNNAASGRTQTYTYDSLDRLLTAQASATSGGDCWGQNFGNNATPPTLAADALANLFYSTSTKCNSPEPRFTADTSTNRFTGTGISYDSAGDMTQDTAYTYTYDAENRITTASGMSGGPYCYAYDFQGARVMKSHASGGSCTGSVTVDRLYWRPTSGDSIADGWERKHDELQLAGICFLCWAAHRSVYAVNQHGPILLRRSSGQHPSGDRFKRIALLQGGLSALWDRGHTFRVFRLLLD